MINNFLIINCIGRNDKIGLKVNDKFFIHDSSSQIKDKDQLVIIILNLIKKHKVNLSNDFSILVNSGPGRFSSMRISLDSPFNSELIQIYGRHIAEHQGDFNPF